MSKKRRIWRLLLCLAVLSLLVLTTSGFRWDFGRCVRTQRLQVHRWRDTWGWHLELRKVTVWICSGGAGAFCAEARAGAAAQPQPAIAMQVPEGYLGVPYPWIMAVKPEAGTEQNFVIRPVSIYDPSILDELKANWPPPPGTSWRVYGADPGDIAKVQAALPPSGAYEVQSEAVFSFHAGVMEPTVPVSEFDPATQEWLPPYVVAPDVPLILEPHVDQKVRPDSKVTSTHTLTNLGAITRTFDLTYLSALGWDYVMSLAQAPGIPVTNTGPVAPGETVDFLVSTWVPLEEAGSVETIVVTATAQDDPAVTQSVVNRIYVWYVSFLPMIRNGTA